MKQTLLVTPFTYNFEVHNDYVVDVADYSLPGYFFIVEILNLVELQNVMSESFFLFSC